MEKLIELLQQIQELAGVAVDALQNAGGGDKPEHGGPPHEGGKPPEHGGPPMHEGGDKPPEDDGQPKKY